MNGKKIFISGNTEQENHQINFIKAEDILLAKGFTVLSPIRTSAYTSKDSRKQCFIDRCKFLMLADGIVQISNVNECLEMQAEQKIAEILNIPLDNSLLNK